MDDLSYIWNLKIQTHRGRRVEWWYPGSEGVREVGRCWSNGAKGQLYRMKMSSGVLMYSMVTIGIILHYILEIC